MNPALFADLFWPSWRARNSAIQLVGRLAASFFVLRSSPSSLQSSTSILPQCPCLVGKVNTIRLYGLDNGQESASVCMSVWRRGLEISKKPAYRAGGQSNSHATCSLATRTRTTSTWGHFGCYLPLRKIRKQEFVLRIRSVRRRKNTVRTGRVV